MLKPPFEELDLQRLPSDQTLQSGDAHLILLQELSGLHILVEGARLVLGDPDPDQVARKVVAQGKSAQRLSREIRLNDLPLEGHAVRPMPSHDFHPPEAQRSGSILSLKTVHSQGRTPLGVRIFYPEEHAVQEQIAFYSRVRHLIFSEGSAVHTLQLMGRLGADISILVRRPWRWHAFASLWPRVRSLRYLRAVEALICGLGPSRRVQHHRGISVLDEAKLLRAFRRIGLDLLPLWDAAEYRASRDRDIRSWIGRRKRGLNAVDEREHIDLQLRSLRIDVRY